MNIDNTFNIVSLGSVVSVLFAAIAAGLRTQAVVDWLDERLLQGRPRRLEESTLKTINDYFQDDEIRIKGILKQHPKLVFKPYTDCKDVKDNIQARDSAAFAKKLAAKGMPNDPHAFIYPKTDIGAFFSSDGENDSHRLFAARSYSDLTTLPTRVKENLSVLGANNLVIDPYKSEIVMHLRDSVSNSYAKTLHGFGGGYMSYWEDGRKTTSVRRDDQKNLRITAMRELNEESGLLSLNHLPNLVYAVEESHVRNEPGKLGHLTFFYVTRVYSSQKSESSHGGDSREGTRRAVALTWKNLWSMIVCKSLEDTKVHPQFRAVLAVWLLQGAPGVHFLRRWRISNPITRRRLIRAMRP